MTETAKTLLLLLAGAVGGAALLLFAFSWLASLGGDDTGRGCAGLAAVLLATALFLTMRALLA